MAAKWLRSGWTLGACVAALFLAVAGCVAYLQRDLLVARWNVNEWLRGDDDPQRVHWLLTHRTWVLPILTDALACDETDRCIRAGVLFRTILDKLGEPTDPEAAQLSLVAMSRLRDEYSGLSPQARHEAAEAAYILLRVHLLRWSPHVPTALDSAGTIFASALVDSDVRVKETALRRLPSLWPAIIVDGSSGPLVRIWLLQAYEASAAMLASAEPAVRLAAAVACIGAPFSGDDYRLADVLDDEDSGVRKEVLVALSQNKRSRLQGTQKAQVVPFLGDSDPAIVAAAVRLLKLGGVSDDRVELLRLRHSVNSADRIKSIALVVSTAANSRIDVPAFLTDLSYDESAEVRLAFIDAASKLGSAGATQDRIRTMAEKDPDAVVRARARDSLAKGSTVKP